MLPTQVQGSTYLERRAGQPLDTFETYWRGFLIKTIPSGQDTGSFQSLNSNSSSCPGSGRNHTIGNSRPVSPEQQLAGWSPRSAQKQCTESSRGLSQPETSPINLTNVRVVHSPGQARERVSTRSQCLLPALTSSPHCRKSRVNLARCQTSQEKRNQKYRRQTGCVKNGLSRHRRRQKSWPWAR